ncbi:MAG: EAL domain-containing protein [Pseudomonadota bacterium]
MEIEKIVASIAEHDRQAIWIAGANPAKGAGLPVLWCNPRFTEMTGHRASGDGATEIVLFDTNGRSACQGLATRLRGTEAFTSRLCYRHGDGATVPAELRFSPVLDVGGAVTAWIVFQRDLSRDAVSDAAEVEPDAPPHDLERDLDAAIRWAKQAESRLCGILNTLADGFVLYDSDDRLIIANDAFRDFHGPVRDKVAPGVSFEELLRYGMEGEIWDYESKDPECWAQHQLNRRRNAETANSLIRLKDGRWLQRNEHRLPNGEMAGLRVDVTKHQEQQRAFNETSHQLELANAKLRCKSMFDEVTGALNRHGLEDAMASIAADQAPDQHLALLYIDVDQFKQIITTLGNDASDYILRAVTTLLRPLLEQNDLLARIGGDAFVLVLDLTAGDRTAEGVARQVVHKLSRPIRYGGLPCHFTASVGVALSPIGSFDPAAMLNNAEIALHRAQNNGCAQIETYSRKIQEAMISRNTIADEIMNGLEHGEFVPHFQPQFDAETLEIVGVEALARWKHPRRGILAPTHFLEIAEEMNIVAEIDKAILEHAVAEMGELSKSGLQPKKLSVNVSLARLTDPNLLRGLDTLDAQGTTLSFELLETIFVDEQDSSFDWRIDQLQERGIELEIDDFGSGRASIVGLTRVSPKRMKIDRQLVIPVTESSTRRRLLAAVIEMGRSLGIGVTAEGVESAEHVGILRELGCDTLQGFALASPMPAEELAKLMAAQAFRSA